MESADESRIAGYDALYRDFDSPVMRQFRQDAYGEDIGQHSWVGADEVRADIDRLSLSRTTRLLDLGCGPCGPLTFFLELGEEWTSPGFHTIHCDMRLAQLSVKTRYSIRVCNMLTPFGMVGWDL